MKIAILTNHDIFTSTKEIDSVLSKISLIDSSENKIDLIYINNGFKDSSLSVNMINQIFIYNKINDKNLLRSLSMVAIDYNENHNPDLFIISLKDSNDDFVPFLASKLSIESYLNCESFNYNYKTKRKTIIKPVYGGNVLGHYTLNNQAVISFSLDARRLVTKKTKSKSKIMFVDYTYDIPKDIKISKSFEIIESNGIKDAKFVIVCGYGVGSQENINLVKEYAKKVGAVVCGTKKVIDLGWLPMNLLIGSTGQLISPDLCLTIGVSGAAPLLNGIIKSKKIIAINKDKDARIFNYADYGITEDFKDVIFKEQTNEKQ